MFCQNCSKFEIVTNPDNITQYPCTKNIKYSMINNDCEFTLRMKGEKSLKDIGILQSKKATQEIYIWSEVLTVNVDICSYILDRNFNYRYFFCATIKLFCRYDILFLATATCFDRRKTPFGATLTCFGRQKIPF